MGQRQSDVFIKRETTHARNVNGLVLDDLGERLIGGQRAGASGQAQHGVRLFPHHQLVGAFHDISDGSSQVIACGIQIIVRRPETEIVKKHLIEGVVVVLTCVNQNLFKVPVAALYGGGQPDDLRPRADDRHQLQLSHCYTSSK